MGDDMPMNPIKPGLRTIHNGSNSVAKAQINVPVAGELTVPEEVADQLQRADSSFKDGPATDEIKAVAEKIEAENAPPAEPEPVVETPASAPAKPKKAAAKKAAAAQA
jgi:hypothetical protein